MAKRKVKKKSKKRPTIKGSTKAIHGAGKKYILQAKKIIKQHSLDKKRQDKMLGKIKQIEKALKDLKKAAGGK